MSQHPPPQFDVLIVGAGVAGCALAHALSTELRSTPLRIGLLERSLEEPDRIVGELMQPGGVLALRKLGLEGVLEGIDAAPVEGYCVYDAARGKVVKIPYPGGHRGRAFHHGRLIMNLRAAAQKAKGVEVIEATVTDLIEDASSRVVGVRASVKGEEDKRTFSARLVVIADGCYSNFRSVVLGPAGKPVTKSHFIGVVLEDAALPIANHGTVCLVKGSGPVLLYRISQNDTRILIDVKTPIPADLKTHILANIAPQLPQCTQPSVIRAIEKDRLRRMPNSWLPSTPQTSASSKPGVLLIGDSWNMRHPLTGGGMTVALNDVASLKPLLGAVENLDDWREVKGALDAWFVARKPLASTVNILSVALYDLFGADAPELEVLRTGCFKYFELGGECVNGPVSILSALAPSPALLTYHFFRVAFYAIWVMFTHPRAIPGEKTRLAPPRLDEYPFLFLRSLQVFYTACVVFGPLLWEEMVVHAMPSRMQILVSLATLGVGYALFL
ncbi:SE domain-containing protein [Mycena indigotica]|uniref:Squalene monooxygenase n=1 Tax=Mycena indigotica TaxID=2126181 RepID=A0A8H6SUQ3_9AGAR|nr:SE domain-containing protein [Mycena indigotica]KAF7306530.1 SE domain-containing protein [Mycena indigotica]